MVGGIEVADIADIPRYRLVAPAGAGEQKAPVVQFAGDGQKKLLDAPLAVGQPVGDQAEIARETRLGRLRMVGRRIKSIIDRHAGPGAEPLVGLNDRRSAAICEHDIKLRDQRVKRIPEIIGDAVERCRRVDIPESGERALTPQLRNARFEQPVEHADPARLDQEIGTAGLLQRMFDTVLGGRIHHDPRPIRVGDVAVFLPVEGVGLVKRDAVTIGGERLQHAAIIGGGAVPVGRDEARSEKGDVEAHCAAAIAPTLSSPVSKGGLRRGRPRVRQIASSSSTR